MAAKHVHPYFPQDAVVPGYAPNNTPLPVILAAFGAIVGAFVLGSVTLAKWSNPALKRAEQLTIGWFALCGCLLRAPKPPFTPTAKSVFQADFSTYSLRVCLYHLHPFLSIGSSNTPTQGYFVLNHAAIPSSQSLFAQLWKEYALSDSRYLTSDPFMLCIESLTVVWPPSFTPPNHTTPLPLTDRTLQS